MQNAEEDILKKLYHNSKKYYVKPNQLLFEIGETTGNVYIILSGMIDIVISDGQSSSQVLDILGPGSVIGMKLVLKNEKWFYRAVNNTMRTTRILTITQRSINKLQNLHQEIGQSVQDSLDLIKSQGFSQIDYVIESNKLQKIDFLWEKQEFQKFQLWKKQDYEGVDRITEMQVKFK